MSAVPSLNIYGRPLEVCGTKPMTGFFRTGKCETNAQDQGSHVVAAVVNDAWLRFSASRGNDLRPILSDGCSWCLCVSRWKEALDAYKAGQLPREAVPAVKLEATHKAALRVVNIEDLEAFKFSGSSSSSASSQPREDL
ncbi:unnamed protein product [Tilletia laevis]|uniref:DUF2237 domain-containing protein n=2 Tax=Tilletia TaxID=13289 RepID=A0A177V8X8_9BASI|nr:hypothetical protein CF336_g608 [Tilletia laevis]KAE8263068.1 hypothetical protein A4X03_0g1953 [Tilletia caries]KAE8207645.1 hypothetical protein CF335_g998 [Tilletia laevis]CAD6888141.1 unnamed protein product [Tilletia caries]CAD6909997.1 unnamed protein product [Tilletia caries]